jgi:hypothetical protein
MNAVAHHEFSQEILLATLTMPEMRTHAAVAGTNLPKISRTQNQNSIQTHPPSSLFLNSGNACTSCDSGAFCLRSPDAASGWECSRFRLDAAQNQPSLYRLQGLKCALATNDVVLASTYAGAVTEYETSASNCLNSKFTANDGKSNDENLRFDCPAPESYKRVCSENKGTMCSVKGFMSNWRSFPAGALVANFTTQVCVPNECRDLSNEPRLNSYFNIAGGAFCTNGSSQGNYLCETTLECVPAPASPISADSQLQKNNEYNAGVIALLVIIVICIIVGLVLLFVLKK